MIKKLIFIFVLLLSIQVVKSQDPWRFSEEIEAFNLQDQEIDLEDVVVFTGSSSVRFWSTLQTDFPDVNIINRGFGGSQTSDLRYFGYKLIMKYNPSKVFIYEGDNDIAEGKSNEVIMSDMKGLVKDIHEHLPKCNIYFISAKPSVARWDFKTEYLDLLIRMQKWSLNNDRVDIIDVWTPMCDANGNVFTDLFIEDNLHMNGKGYRIWKEVVKPYLHK